MTKKLLFCFLLAIMYTCQARSQGFDFLWQGLGSLTGQGLVDRLKKAAIDVLEKAENVGNSVADNISAELNKNADQLARILNQNITKPLTELRKSFETQIERSLVALNQVESFLNSYRSCFKSDFRDLLSGLEGTLTYNVSNSIPWAKKTPVVLNVKKIGSDAVLGMRVSEEQQVIEIIGANFLHNSKCPAQLSITNVKDNKAVDCKIVTIDPKKITVTVSSINQPGIYKLSIQLREKGWFGCKSPKLTEATFVVLPEPKFKFAYKIVPSCTVKQTIAFEAGRLDGTNDECNGWKTYSQNFVMPNEWKYTGYNWVLESMQGCEGGATYSGGNMVSVSYRCQERGGFLCTGARKWVHGKMVIYGEKELSQTGTLIQGEVPQFLKFGQSVSVNPVAPVDCQLNGNWSVSISVIFPDGTKYDIPEATGERPLSGSISNGASFYWNPTTFTLTVTAPPSNCGEL